MIDDMLWALTFDAMSALAHYAGAVVVEKQQVTGRFQVTVQNTGRTAVAADLPSAFGMLYPINVLGVTGEVALKSSVMKGIADHAALEPLTIVLET